MLKSSSGNEKTKVNKTLINSQKTNFFDSISNNDSIKVKALKVTVVTLLQFSNNQHKKTTSDIKKYKRAR